MPYPDYWPDDSKFVPLHWFLEGRTSSAIKEKRAAATLAGLAGIQAFLTDKYHAGGEYQVAELTQPMMWTTISAQVSNTPRHAAGYTQDKYFPVREIKGTPAGPGQTTLKNFQEFFNCKRMDVKAGEWGVLLILVCKNQDRWTKFEQCRQNFTAVGVDARADMQAIQWATGAQVGTFPVIDPQLGECYLWSGQSLDILHGVMAGGFQRIHCASNAATGYGALGRGNYFTDKFSKALLYALNLRNQYFGAAKGTDIRVLMLSRVLLGNYMSLDTATAQERQDQKFAHNVELTGSAQRHKRVADPNYQDYHQSVPLYRDAKLTRAPMQKGWKANYQITGMNRDANIGKESAHQTHKGSNEFLVAIGKQIYPEFLVFVAKT